MEKSDWYVAVADFICKLLAEMDDEDFVLEVLDTMDKADKDPNHQKYIDYDAELLKLYEKDSDVESAGYKVMQILKELKDGVNTQ